MTPSLHQLIQWIGWNKEHISHHLKAGELRAAISHAKQNRQFYKDAKMETRRQCAKPDTRQPV